MEKRGQGRYVWSDLRGSGRILSGSYLVFLVRLPPTSSTLSFSLAVIITYHIVRTISIDKPHNLAHDILGIFNLAHD